VPRTQCRLHLLELMPSGCSRAIIRRSILTTGSTVSQHCGPSLPQFLSMALRG
jgi:hypothetical protein